MSENKKSRLRLLWLIPLAIATAFILYNNKNNVDSAPYKNMTGRIFGTLYAITYQYNSDLQADVEEELQRFDASLSPFNPNSIITRINQNEDIETDTLFRNVFRKAQEISVLTDGAFDGTIAALANAWGFGFKQGEWPDSLMIDSLLQLTDYRKISMQNGKVVKEDPRIMISYSAVAKGYATDVIADFLESKGVKNFMVDIGGEIVVKGQNPRKAPWRIGISKPDEDVLANQEVLLRFQLTDRGVATSGNYRNFYYKDGKRYAHTIDPRSGYPVQHSLLSATVVAKDCMTADALATAFMVMGLEKAEEFVNQYPEIGACFIYSDEEGNYQTYLTDNLKQYLMDF